MLSRIPGGHRDHGLVEAEPRFAKDPSPACSRPDQAAGTGRPGVGRGRIVGIDPKRDSIERRRGGYRRSAYHDRVRVAGRPLLGAHRTADQRNHTDPPPGHGRFLRALSFAKTHWAPRTSRVMAPTTTAVSLLVRSSSR